MAAAGRFHVVALVENLGRLGVSYVKEPRFADWVVGTKKMLGWGGNQHGQLGALRNSSDTLVAVPVEIAWPADKIELIASLECGEFHTVVLTTDGEVWSWGYNGEGQLAILVMTY